MATKTTTAKFSLKKNTKNFGENFKAAVQAKELISNIGWSAAGAALYVLPPTAAGLTGWKGLLMAFGVPWLTGVFLGKKELQRIAWSFAGIQLVYSLGAGAVETVFNKPIFRLGDESKGTLIGSTPATVTGLRDDAQLQPGTSIFDKDGMMYRKAPELENAIPQEATINDYFPLDKTLSGFGGMVRKHQKTSWSVGNN